MTKRKLKHPKLNTLPCLSSTELSNVGKFSGVLLRHLHFEYFIDSPSLSSKKYVLIKIIICHNLRVKNLK
jgi:hypothetical protein